MEAEPVPPTCNDSIARYGGRDEEANVEEEPTCTPPEEEEAAAAAPAGVRAARGTSSPRPRVSISTRWSTCTTEDIFQKKLNAYTITHAIEDRNVLRFHVDYYKSEGKNKPKVGETLAKKAIVEAMLEKHDTATARRKFNAVLATASINDAIAYHALFKEIQALSKEDLIHLKLIDH